MANIRYFNIQDCSNGNNWGLYIDDPSSELIVGNVYLFSGVTTGGVKTIPYGCYTIIGEKKTDQITPNGVLINSYGIEGCQECLNVNANTLIFSDCSGVFGTVYFNVIDFVPTPTIGDVFYLDFYLSGKFGGNERYNGCFELIDKILSDPNRTRYAYLTSATTQTDCETCTTDSPIVYAVVECLTESTYYVALPNNTYSNHLITFTDLGEITQFCGTVKQIVEGEPITGIVVTDLGDPESTGIKCDDCLATVAEKTIITNCLDGHEDVVWASALFSAGDATNISTGQGCYEITGPADPGTGVTYNELADFDPHSDCENCIECHGVTYDFTTCEEITIKTIQNVLNRNQYGGSDIVYDGSTYAYVTNQYSNTISKIDISTNTETQVLNANPYPEKLSINSPGTFIISISYNHGIFTITDTSTGNATSFAPPISGQPFSVHFNPNNGFFYIAWWRSGSSNSYVSVHNVTAVNTQFVVTTFDLGSTSTPTEMIQVGNDLYVSLPGDGVVKIIDLTTNSITNTIYVPNVYSMSYDGSNLIYMTGTDNNYYVYNISLTLISQYTPGFASCCCPKGILIDSVNNEIYVTDYCENAIYIIDSNTNTISLKYNNSDGNVSQVRGMVNISGSIYFASYNNTYTVGTTTDFVNGSIDSYEYIPVGNSFFNPFLNICCEVTGVRPDLDSQYTFYSLISSGTCLDCSSTQYESFYCEECNTGITGLFVAPLGVYSVGQFVKSHWGNSDWLCFEIIDNWDINSYGTPEIIFEGEGMSPYGTCEECQQNSTVGITVINCDTLVPSYVRVTLPQWLEISGLIGFSQPVISDTNGVCYTVINTCPIGNTGDEFPLVEFYLNQQQCRLDNTYFIYSANTEQPVCILDCSGNTITVYPPHPVWTSGGTDGAGRLRTIIQLDAVQLGGTNGYYS